MAKKLAIVGAGVFGLANAYQAAMRGWEVTVFERSPFASGASVRNFGMIWPIGQRVGEVHDLALRSRNLWIQLCEQAGLWIQPCGSIHLAHREDEYAVLAEFHDRQEIHHVDCTLLGRDEVLARTPAANPDRLIGGLFSSAECCVNSRQIIRELPNYLSKSLGVEFHFNSPVLDIISIGKEVDLRLLDRSIKTYDRVLVCGGVDIQQHFPESFYSGATCCKLQMLKTVPQPNGYRIGPHLAGGLTLRHYKNFEICPSLPALQDRIEEETPELNRFGIHVMISQNDLGEVILGDSHEYGDSITPFDKTQIDELIVRELRRIVRLPSWEIQERWHGIYAKHPDAPVILSEPSPNVFLFAATGGTGMTLSMGLAEDFWNRKCSVD